MAIRELNFSYFEEQSFGHLNPDLRNSFAHFLITYNGENLSIKDKRYDKKRNEWKTTMIGNIKRKHFNTLFQIFFKQKAQAENEYQKFINK